MFINKFDQSLYFQLNNNGAWTVDVAIRLENLDEGLRWIINEIGGTYNPHGNKFASNHRKGKRYAEYYDDKTRNMVLNHCEKELTAFGYTFAGPTDNKSIIDLRSIPFNISY